MAKLILRGKDGNDQEFPLDEKGSVTIGRSPECDITIDDTQASRRHCSVVKLQSGFEVADLGSTNGTLLNSTLVKRQKLSHGDVIRIGAVEIAFSDPGSAGATGGGESANCVLVYAKGDRKGDRIELTQQRTTLGRKQTNTVVLADPVCSSYHCEIVRDLNGYTIRDLGSTNGTLVNGEMITEAPLTHGARVRVGNTRFVFQDPAMAEVDLDLAAAEDEDEWGMMREIDLAAVRKRNPALIVYTVLFLGIVGGLFALTQMKPGERDLGPASPDGNLVEDFSFEARASRFAWESEPVGTVTTAIQSQVKGQGQSALSLKSNTEQAEAYYGRARPGSDARYRLTYRAAARGGTARVGLLWTGLGLERWADPGPIRSAGLQEFSIEPSAPPWATRVRLGARIEGSGTVYLDDVVWLRIGRSAPQTVEVNSFVFSVVDESALDVAHEGAPVLAHGRPFARDASGNAADVAFAVSVEKTDDAHVTVTVTVTGDAALAGLAFEEVSGYLTRGGFRAFTPDADPTFHASFPDEGTLALEGVRKLLLGPSGRALGVLAAADDGRLHSEARVEGRDRVWAVFGEPRDGVFSFRFKADLRGEFSLASDRMAHANNLYRTERYGDFLREASKALAEFPFADKLMRDQLATRIAEVNQKYVELRNRIDENLADYREFRDLQSLDNARAVFEELRERFQIEPGEGPRGEHLARAMAEEEALRTAALRKQQVELAKPLVETAIYLSYPQGEAYSTAVYLTHVKTNLPYAWRLATAEDVAPEHREFAGLMKQAHEALADIEKNHPEVIQVLGKLGLG